MKYKLKCVGNHRTVKSKRIIFVICAEFENAWWELLDFLDGEYSTNWWNNIVAVITRSRVEKVVQQDKLKTEHFVLHYPQEKMICRK